MSLVRMALRLAMLEALAPHQTEPPAWPTIARSRFHDSRLDPVDIQSRHPEVVMSIEVAEGKSASDQNAGRPQVHVVEIVFSMTMFIEERSETGELTGEILVAESDHDAEDLLDTLEEQILYTLENNAWVRRFAPRFLTALHAEPFRDDETGVKFANRALKITAELAASAEPDLSAFLATLPEGERQDRGTRALEAMAATYAVVDGSPLPLEATDDVLVVQTAPASAEPDETSRRVRFNAYGLPLPA